MYRLLKCEKDTYIQNKFINGSRSIDANVGQAGTLDLYKLWNETILINGSGSGIELSRLLVEFDLAPLRQLTGSILDLSNSSFKCFLSLKDVYGGQTTPSNFTVSVFPLAKEWDEGRGTDIIAYRDLDVANFVSASSTEEWSIAGAAATGTLGTSSLDIYTAANFGAGVVSLECKQTFTRGDEDLLVDITSLISGTLAGLLPDYGFRLSFTSSQESDSSTRFVKRFGTRHTANTALRPKLLVKYNDTIIDDNQMLYFDVPNTLYFYNNYRGTKRNFFSGVTEITGSDSLLLKLVSSKSVSQTTSSYQASFSASITYLTTSFAYFSQSFSASQLSFGNNQIDGVYHSTFILSSSDSFFGTSPSYGFNQYWTSVDGLTTYATGNFVAINRIIGGNSNSTERNVVTNITNLKNFYTENEVTRLRVFAQDYSTEVVAYRIPQTAKPTVFKSMYYRILEAFSRDIIVPFDTSATKLSTDANGMYFDLYITDFEPNHVYEIEFMINEDGKDYLIANQGFRFKVVK